ncbi:hypothetical protein [Raoultella terrigena]|jgi:hypothetical protein|uniref:hypothetical protein n=1 Tax=Raoultella terrigena TaxID=577 RepID=UPI000E02EB2D|nr:hypothetical protein [Raoultella terrigena]NWK89010.1 hypothetical protein [Raoultella terrigena]SUQ55816.1 Uncharacterised protein [Raoultella terrigena]
MTISTWWGKYHLFRWLAVLACGQNTPAQTPGVPVAAQIAAHCTLSTPWRQNERQQQLSNQRYMLVKHRRLQLLLQQNSLSIETYDRLWSEYQRNRIRLETHRLCGKTLAASGTRLLSRRSP